MTQTVTLTLSNEEKAAKVHRLSAAMPEISSRIVARALDLADGNELLATNYLMTLTPATIEGRLRARVTDIGQMMREANTPEKYAAAVKIRKDIELIAEMTLRASEYDREGEFALYAALANVANLMQRHLDRKTTTGDPQ